MFSKGFDTVLNCARNEALRTGHCWIHPPHLLLAIIRTTACSAHNILGKLGYDCHSAKFRIDEALFRQEALPYDMLYRIRPSEAVLKVITYAVANATAENAAEVGSRHLLLGLCCSSDQICTSLLKDRGIDRAAIMGDPGGSVEETGLPDMSRMAEDIEREILRSLGTPGTDINEKNFIIPS